MEVLFPVQYSGYFLLIIGAVFSLVVSVLYYGEGRKGVNSLFFFMLYFWLVVFSFLTWNTLFTNSAFLLSGYVCLFAYLKRYSIPFKAVYWVMAAIQWGVFLGTQQEPGAQKAIGTLVSLGLLSALIFCVILKSANFENKGESLSLVATGYNAIAAGIILPYVLLTKSDSGYIFALLLSNAFSLSILFGAVLSTFLYDSILENKKLSVTDELSGLHNRRYFVLQGQLQITQAQRHMMPISLLVCDIDNFKAINDNHGHATGDEAIKVFAAVLKEQLRMEDIVARIGGEEFAVVMPSTDLSQARLTAERIRGEIAKHTATLASTTPAFTVSFGLCDLSGKSIDEGLKCADTALYKAKDNGRNRVEVSSGTPVLARI